ncbi:unnamed protein product [Schistocephalus solidus]|uniref:Retrovirus-related Pol polyprotein from transposon TNT 1-94 n=1 Tax=Schistocephalus solidus TaxID=70667 RepID=A0A183T982_SCHSO|nr:unnamed protein product [Schistocephalus solidus]
MGDNLLGKSVKELQKLTVHSAPPPEKLTRKTNFALWEARCKDYLQGLDARAHSGAILALLDDEVYDLALSADISAATAPSAVLDSLREILGRLNLNNCDVPIIDSCLNLEEVLMRKPQGYLKEKTVANVNIHVRSEHIR